MSIKSIREVHINSLKGTSEINFCNNSINLCRYTSLTIVFNPLFNLFSQPSFIFFLIQTLLDIFFNNSFLTLALLLLLTTLFLISELKTSIPQISLSNVLNRQKIEQWNGSGFIQVQSKDLLVGQIIKISGWVPADLIILASENEKVFTKSYKDNMEEKSQPKTLKKIIFYENSDFIGLDRLFGVAEVEEVKEQFSDFQGKIKIKGKPNSTKLSNDNILYQGSKVKGVVLGLVIFTGQDTKFMKMLKNKYKNSLMNNKINKKSYFLLVPFVFFVIFSTVPAYLQLDEFSLFGSIAYYFLLYSNFLPISLFIVLEILRSAHYLATRPALKNVGLAGFHKVENIGNTEFVFCDEKCIMAPPAVSKFVYDDNILEIPTEETIQATVITERSLNMGFLKPEIETEIWDLVVLSTSVEKIGEKFVGIKNEIAMINAAEKNGVFVKEKNLKQVVLRILGELAQYEVVAINKLENRTRVVVKQANSGYLLVQGPEPSVSNLLTDTGNHISEEFSSEFFDKGLMPFTILYKKLNSDEILKISEKVNKISTNKVNVEKKEKKLFNKLEKDLTYLTTLAIEYFIDEKNRNAIQDLIKAGIKVCMLSSEDHFKAEALVNSLEFSPVVKLIGLESEASCYKALQKAIVGKLYKNINKRDESRVETLKDYEETVEQKNYKYSNSEKLIVNHKIFRKFTIKNNLDCLNHDYRWDKKVFLLVDRNSFLLCIKNKVTLRMFVGLIAASQGMLFYSLNPDDKVLLVNCVQNHIKNKPGVFALCHNFWSLGMAQVSYSCGSPCSKMPLDFRKIQFSALPELISRYKLNWQISEFSIFWCIYKNIYEVLIQFIYQFFQQFSAASIWIPNFGLFFNIITSLQLFSRKPGKVKFFNYFLSLSAQIIILICVLVYPSKTAIFGEGKTENFEIFSKILYICVVCNIIIQALWETKSIIGFVLACSLLIIVCTLAEDTNAYNSGYFWMQVFISGLLLNTPMLVLSLFPHEVTERKYKNLASVYKDSDLFTNENEYLAKRKYSLKFKSKRAENEFRRFYSTEILFVIKLSLFVLFIILLVWTITTVFIEDSTSTKNNRIVITVGFFLFFLISLTTYFKENISFCITIVLFFSIALKNVIEFSSFSLSIISTLLLPTVSFILLNADWVLICYINLLTYILNIITISLFFSNSLLPQKFSTLLLTSFLFLISSAIGYEIEKYYRKVFILNLKIQIQVENTQSILEILLPEFVIDRVKAGVRYIAEDRGEVTVIFCDICDFETLCSDYSPKEFSSLLDSIFSVFDALCEDFAVTKIETVGKTYMASCGLNKVGENEISPARAACDLALAMINEAEKINTKKGVLKVKIGINTGPVTAGVVGFHKPQFSLVGDTVNTASRMCSTLKSSNSVQISVSTYDAIQDYSGLSFISNTIIAKGKGEMETYIVTKDKSRFEFLSTRKRSNLSPPKVNNWRKSVMAREDTELIPSIWKLKNKTPRHAEYISKKIKSRANGVKFLLLITGIFYLFLVISNATSDLSNNFLVFELVTKVLVSSFAFILLFIHSKLHSKPLFYHLTLILYMIAYLSSVLSIYSKLNETFIIEVSCVLLLINHTQYLDLIPILLLNASLIAVYLIFCHFLAELTVQEILLLAFFGVINFVSLQKIESEFQKSFNLKIKSNKEIRDTEHLLVQMMPAHVVYRLSEGSSVTDKLFDVTILYADIVGFTAWSSGKSPVEVVQMLSNLFTEFDKKCVEFGVYKVHTIGDCYVILGFLSGKRDPFSECWNVYSIAKSMIKIIEEENQKYSMQLAMRIGMHTGNLIAGVIGSNVVRYDIWGKDVMIANKMESHGQSGKICVSKVSKEILEEITKGTLSFEYNKEVDGIETYFVNET